MRGIDSLDCVWSREEPGLLGCTECDVAVHCDFRDRGLPVDYRETDGALCGQRTIAVAN